MTCRGRVQNGAIVLDDPGVLPEGVEVEILPMPEAEIPAFGEQAETCIE